MPLTLALSRGERVFFVRIFVLISIYDTDGCLSCQWVILTEWTGWCGWCHASEIRREQMEDGVEFQSIRY